MKAPNFRPLLRINTKKLEVDDEASSRSVTPTIAHYKPPVPEKELPVPPRPTTPTVRLTFLAIWDPESEEYTLPPLHFEDGQDPPFLEWHEDEGFYESLQSGHPECEPHLPSRFSTSTTSTSNFISISEPHTPMPFLDCPPPARKPQREESRPEISAPFLLTPAKSLPHQRIVSTTSSYTSLTAFISRKPSLSSTRSRSRPPTPKRSFTAPVGPESPLSFLKRRVSSSASRQSDDHAWVSIELENVITERVIYV
ncbi:hypothetical protein BDZ89DRAFT_1162785 [Hymenopellis radicata]|nr:hypothetical protein BDZ89DRAFT_1162785 [Hymenopellis radicata]